MVTDSSHVPDELPLTALREWRAHARRQQDQLYEQIREFGKSFDQTLVTLAAGAIAGSVAFADRLTPDGRNFLIAAWVCLAAALLSVLLSFQAAVANLDRHYQAGAVEEAKVLQMELIVLGNRHEEIQDILDDVGELLTKIRKPSFAAALLPWLNYLAIALLMSGVISLLIAVSLVRAA
ncbi:MAG TPA: hypothetical protein VNA69_19795 [Thermoanaerobaculia bacterium]|nr:hypothetical protein [Thermoanaerobaculia bacterium]